MALLIGDEMRLFPPNFNLFLERESDMDKNHGYSFHSKDVFEEYYINIKVFTTIMIPKWFQSKTK
jgi:hypothetical protein